MVLPGAIEGLSGAIAQTLKTPSGELLMDARPLAGRFDRCIVYASPRDILIRPFISPTSTNHTFDGARQRVYLSATLGGSGELERAFGRRKIRRLPLPESAGTPRSGRRFVVFASLLDGVDSDEAVRSLLAESDRAIILTPSAWAAQRAADELLPPGWKVFKREDVEKDFAKFAKSRQAACVLANRYDGLDLPAEVCRVVTLAGHPRATNLQEEFLATRVRASAAIAERVRARVVQGSGRCTRGPRDYALVIIADDDLASYLARPDVRRTLDPALQAELEFGFSNSGSTLEETIENVRHFLKQDATWQNDAEPHIAKLQAQVERALAPGADSLSAAAPHEIQALERLWDGAWQEAAVSAIAVTETLQGVDAVRPYRSFWTLLGAYFTSVAAMQGLGGSVASAEAQLKLAQQASQPQSWVREALPSIPQLQADATEPFDNLAAARIAAELARPNFNSVANGMMIEKMLADVAGTASKPFETALTTLGRLLGADAYKPEAKGNCDSAWCWENQLWLTLEAKSEESPDSPLSIETVRQTNHHLTLLAADRNGAAVPFPRAASVVVSPRHAIDEGAVTLANEWVYLTDLEEIRSLAGEVKELWIELRGLKSVDATERPLLAREVMARRRLLPSDVVQRLTGRAVAAS